MHLESGTANLEHGSALAFARDVTLGIELTELNWDHTQETEIATGIVCSTRSCHWMHAKSPKGGPLKYHPALTGGHVSSRRSQRSSKQSSVRAAMTNSRSD